MLSGVAVSRRTCQGMFYRVKNVESIIDLCYNKIY
jgi:hypothetical protein